MPIKFFLANSGNEANEAAIKLARKYFFEKGDEEKYEILSFTNSFHGRSLANITLGDSEFHQTGFGPLPKGFIKAEFNNIEDVKKKISNKTAIIVELIQGEAGVISAQNDFVEASEISVMKIIFFLFLMKFKVELVEQELYLLIKVME